MRVLLFVTCLVDRFLPDAAAAATLLLRRLGVDVVVPPDQTCCGQPAYNAGYRPEATAVAAHTLRVLDGTDCVVVPSGSCAAMLRHHYVELMGQDAAAAANLARRTFELSAFLVRVLGVTDLGRGLDGRRVAYHHGCHGLRELNIRAEPLLLLRNAGAELVEWEAAEECCGFGGLFSVRLPEVSAAMADRKLSTLPGLDGGASLRPDVLTSADGGCLLQLAGRMQHQGIDLPVRHLAQLLNEACNGRA